MDVFPKVKNDDINLDSEDNNGRRSTFFRNFTLKMRKGARKSTYMYRMGWDDDRDNPRFSLLNDIFEK